MKRFRDFAIFLFFSLGLAIVITGSLFNYYLSPINHDIIEKEIKITDGKNLDKISSVLYEEHLIRNPKVFKIYLKIKGVDEFKEGSFKIKSNMSSKEIVNLLSAITE